MFTAASDDPDIKAYERMLANGSLNQYKGQYVAFLDGRLVAHGAERDDVIKDVEQKYNRMDMFLERVGEEVPVIHLRRPFQRFNSQN